MLGAHRCEYGDVEEVSAMTTAIIGTGGIGSAIARLLGSGGEALRLSSADSDSARKLAAEIGPDAVVQ
jgi:predicted dinucleotide-binding enzyme